MEASEHEIDNIMSGEATTGRWPLWRTFVIFAVPIIAVILIAGFIVWESQTSWLQARCMTRIASELSFQTEPGPSPSIRFPSKGPYDRRMGYAHLQDFTDRLTANGYEIESQARFSPRMLDLTEHGIFTTYREKNQAGLRILDDDDELLSAALYPNRVYRDFDSIPDLVVNTLLFIENRELLDPRYPYHNPAVEWDRFTKATFDTALNLVNKNHEVTGGSTLATQLEKFRHSPEGRTSEPTEKLRQMASAALRVYQNGRETLEAQRQIVLNYINSMPLAAIPGYGEVNSLSEGLWAWYGADFDFVTCCLDDLATGPGELDPAIRARAYKQVLSLFLAHRRPSFYLIEDPGALEPLTNSYVPLLVNSGVIPGYMRDYVLKADLKLRRSMSIQPDISFLERKAVDSVRVYLSSILGVPQLYDLDRFDLTVKSTLDKHIQDEVVKTLQQLGEPEYANSSGVVGFRMLSPDNDLSKVIYSFTLYERLGNANLLRIQADTLDQPFNINEGVKLELGSTAKLRALITYLEIMTSLHEQYANLSKEEQRNVHVPKADRLSQWAIGYLSTTSDKRLLPMLKAAMQRRYSASPGEGFFTGGGRHTFVNFDDKHNGQVMSVQDGLLNSVNLVFIRLMRDIVDHYMFKVPGSTAQILEDIEDPRRQVYLSRFADREGRIFLNGFYRKYAGKSPKEAMDLLLQSVRPVPSRLATVFRSVVPEAGIQEFAAFMRSQLPDSKLDYDDMVKFYEDYSQSSFNLADRGYIARIHPLELWTVGYLRQHPEASRSEVIEASASERQEVYSWLFKTRRKHAQDIRIRTLLEIEAFQEIHKAWQRLGYPFSFLVPSYATAIGSSADRPASLAELVGIILNDGVKYPMVRIQELHFAEGTPYETVFLNKKNSAERVLSSEIAEVVKEALIGVVEEGTARRGYRAFLREDETYVVMGGKTGTGDNRREIYGARGRLIKSEAINRTATFVFLIGDRFFGTITVYVDGPESDQYGFTSSLPVQIMKVLAPKLMPLIEGTEDKPSEEPVVADADHPDRTRMPRILQVYAD